jgi:hypothetical protein
LTAATIGPSSRYAAINAFRGIQGLLKARSHIIILALMVLAIFIGASALGYLAERHKWFGLFEAEDVPDR